jgi:hypothetical protein
MGSLNLPSFHAQLNIILLGSLDALLDIPACELFVATAMIRERKCLVLKVIPLVSSEFAKRSAKRLLGYIAFLFMV